ncbi:MAG: hypothetical protein GY716_25790 [bacterium]|nr:hypothetical protein [bacterium]
MRRSGLLVVQVLLCLATFAHAAEPSGLMNYQGVLRDSSGIPIDGSREMVFRFYDASGDPSCSVGTLLLTDSHTGAGAVTLANGQFNVLLGSGSIAAGTEATLAETFRDNAGVWLEVEVGGEALCPRIRVGASGFALNADSLDGVDSSGYLDTSSSAQSKSGDLTVQDLTVSGGDLDLGAGSDDDLTAADVTTLTGGGNADTLHTHSMLGSVGLGDATVTGNLTVDTDTLFVNAAADKVGIGTTTLIGQLSIDSDLSAPAVQITSTVNSNVFQINGLAQPTLFANAANDIGYSVRMFSDSNARLILRGGGDLEWGDGTNFVDTRLYRDGVSLLRTNDDFSIDGTLRTGGPLNAGLPAGTALGYNAFGDDDPHSVAMVSTSDVFVNQNLEVGGSAFLDRHLFMESSASGEADGDQNIYFYNGGSNLGELLGWDESADSFAMSDSLQITGPFQAGTSIGTPVGYNAFGDTDPLSGAMGNDGDVFVNFDLEVGASAFLNRTLYMESSASGESDGDQAIYFYEDNDRDAEYFLWDDSADMFFLSDSLQVGNAFQAGISPDQSYGYNAFGNVTPISSAISNDGDLYVQWDLEIGAFLFLNRAIYMEADSGGGETDGDQNIWFYDDNSRTDEYFRWFELDGDFLLSDELQISGPKFEILGESWGYIFSEGGDMYFLVDSDNDSVNALWRWNNNTLASGDRLMQLEGDGGLFIGGVINQNTSFDLAESFLMAEPMQPGHLVRIDAERPDAVRLTEGEGDGAVLGVVSSDPGIVLGGSAFSVEAIEESWGADVAQRFRQQRDALRGEVLELHQDLRQEDSRLQSFDSYAAFAAEDLADRSLPYAVGSQDDPVADDLARAQPQRRTPSDEELMERYQEALGNHETNLVDKSIQRFFEKTFAPVALSGRVPVQVDASFGAIAPGDYLTPSPVPGIAMKATRPGPIVGTALEGLAEGPGQVLTFVHRGHYTPGGGVEAIKQEIAEELDERTADPVTGIQSVAGNLQLVLDRDANDRARLSVFRDGESDLRNELLRVDEEGNLHVKGAVRPSSLDLAEYHPVNERVAMGDVLVVDVNSPGVMRLGREPSDPAVVGIVSAEPGLLLGAGMTRIGDADPALARKLDQAREFGDLEEEARLWHELERKFERSHAPLALSGTVDCKVDAGYGAIRVGDLLTSSATPGHAMRADDPRPGTIIGKALEPLDTGTGTVKVLVMLR